MIEKLVVGLLCSVVVVVVVLFSLLICCVPRCCDHIYSTIHQVKVLQKPIKEFF